MIPIDDIKASLEINITLVTLTSALLVTSVIIVACVLTKASPHASEIRQTKLGKLKRETKTIKKRAEKKKSVESRQPCCLCCYGNRDDQGPVPNAPYGIELQDPTSTSVTILWNEPETEDDEAQVLGYKIFARFKAKKADDWTHVGKVKPEFLEYRIKNLVADRKYVFGVSCRGNYGESAIAESEPIALRREPVRPSAPSEFHCASKTSNSVTLCWKPPVRNGHARIHTYYLTKKDLDTRDTWLLVATLQAFDRYMDYKVTGLKEKHQYRFRVTAENVAGIGPNAETVTIEMLDLEPQPPGRPTGPIKYARISHTSITVSWMPPEDHGGAPVSGYAIEYKDKNSVGWRKAGVVDADRTRHTVSSLPEDVEFIFRVIAINTIGNSPPLVGGKAKTKLLAIPLSRRSTFREITRYDVTRNTKRTDRSTASTVGVASGNDVGLNLSGDLDTKDGRYVVNSPFVPQSDFFSVDESEFGTISTRHSENKTRHSQYSPLPKMGSTQPGYSFQGRKSTYSTVGSRKRKHTDIVKGSVKHQEPISRSARGSGKHHSKEAKQTVESLDKQNLHGGSGDQSQKFPKDIDVTDNLDLNYDHNVESKAKPNEDATGRYLPREHHLDYQHMNEDLKDYKSPVPDIEDRSTRLTAYHETRTNIANEHYEEPLSARSAFVSYQIPANMAYNK